MIIFVVYYRYGFWLQVIKMKLFEGQEIVFNYKIYFVFRVYSIVMEIVW